MTREQLIKYLESGKFLRSEIGGWYAPGGKSRKIPVETCDYLQNNLDLSEVTIKGKYIHYYRIYLSNKIDYSLTILNIKRLKISNTNIKTI